jgi:hypothetical protein
MSDFSTRAMTLASLLSAPIKLIRACLSVARLGEVGYRDSDVEFRCSLTTRSDLAREGSRAAHPLVTVMVAVPPF